MSDADFPGAYSAAHHNERAEYPTPQAAVERAALESIAYVAGTHVGTAVDAPDFLAVVDLDPNSDTFQEIVHRVDMPNVGDGLHRMGWNACSSFPGREGFERRYLLVPGIRSSRIHVVDTDDRRQPAIVDVIDPELIHEYDLSAPHTVHPVPGGSVMISALGDARGDSPAGFLELNEYFEIEGRYDTPGDVERNCDFWYQPRKGVMVSSEWATPNEFLDGFDSASDEVETYGHRLHVWDWNDRLLYRTIDLGEDGVAPTSVRFLHCPETTHGYVSAALSSNVFHFWEDDGIWRAEKVLEFEDRDHPGREELVPAFASDLVVSMDDRYLFGSNWLHGEVWMADVSDPTYPRLVDSLSVGGLFGDVQAVRDRKLAGGPQTIRLSLDGTRLYWTTSLYDTWDDQFFPREGDRGSVLLKADVDPRRGSLQLDDEFLVDFGDLPEGPARARDVRWPGGDCTSEIWQ